MDRLPPTPTAAENVVAAGLAKRCVSCRWHMPSGWLSRCRYTSKPSGRSRWTRTAWQGGARDLRLPAVGDPGALRVAPPHLHPDVGLRALRPSRLPLRRRARRCRSGPSRLSPDDDRPVVPFLPPRWMAASPMPSPIGSMKPSRWDRWSGSLGGRVVRRVRHQAGAGEPPKDCARCERSRAPNPCSIRRCSTPSAGRAALYVAPLGAPRPVGTAEPGKHPLWGLITGLRQDHWRTGARRAAAGERVRATYALRGPLDPSRLLAAAAAARGGQIGAGYRSYRDRGGVPRLGVRGLLEEAVVEVLPDHGDRLVTRSAGRWLRPPRDAGHRYPPHRPVAGRRHWARRPGRRGKAGHEGPPDTHPQCSRPAPDQGGGRAVLAADGGEGPQLRGARRGSMWSEPGTRRAWPLVEVADRTEDPPVAASSGSGPGRRCEQLSPPVGSPSSSPTARTTPRHDRPLPAGPAVSGVRVEARSGDACSMRSPARPPRVRVAIASSLAGPAWAG